MSLRKSRAAVASSPEVEAAAEELLRKGNAVDAVVAGVFAACAIVARRAARAGADPDRRRRRRAACARRTDSPAGYRRAAPARLPDRRGGAGRREGRRAVAARDAVGGGRDGRHRDVRAGPGARAGAREGLAAPRRAREDRGAWTARGRGASARRRAARAVRATEPAGCSRPTICRRSVPRCTRRRVTCSVARAERRASRGPSSRARQARRPRARAARRRGESADGGPRVIIELPWANDEGGMPVAARGPRRGGDDDGGGVRRPLRRIRGGVLGRGRRRSDHRRARAPRSVLRASRCCAARRAYVPAMRDRPRRPSRSSVETRDPSSRSRRSARATPTTSCAARSARSSKTTASKPTATRALVAVSHIAGVGSVFRCLRSSLTTQPTSRGLPGARSADCRRERAPAGPAKASLTA